MATGLPPTAATAASRIPSRSPREPLGVGADRRTEAPPVLGHARRVVVRRPTEVERGVPPLADPADAGREGDRVRPWNIPMDQRQVGHRAPRVVADPE